MQPHRGKFLLAKNDKQKLYIQLIREKRIVFAIGEPGTGKSFIPCSLAIQDLNAGKIDKIILLRPVVEAGESLGFLPGDLNEKIQPYILPLLYQFIDAGLEQKELELLVKDKKIEVIPFAFLRGHTFRNCMVLADECISGDMKIDCVVNGKKSTYGRKINTLVRLFKNGHSIQILSLNEKTKQTEYKDAVDIFETGEKETTEIYLKYRKRPLVITNNHPVAIIDSDGNLLWKQVKDLIVGDKIVRLNRRGNQNRRILNPKLYDVILGGMLGDGSLSRCKQADDSFRYRKNHGLSQYEYLLLCMNTLGGFETKGAISGYTGKPLCAFSTKSMELSPEFVNAILDDECQKHINNIDKYITARTLSLWYMDDGNMNLNGPICRFHTEGFNHEIIENIREVLTNKFNIQTKISITKHKYEILTLDVPNTDKLMQLIAEYIHPSLDYKLPEKYRNQFNPNHYKEDFIYYEDQSVGTITDIKRGRKVTTYNMSVKDNNNYYAEGLLIHNCENASFDQLKNLITRIGDDCRIVINGDIAQSDLPRHLQGGLEKIINKLCDGEIEEIGFIKFNRNEIVRDPLISKILDKLEYNIIDPPIKDTWKQYYDPDAEED